jgi:hypothetical protein
MVSAKGISLQGWGGAIQEDEIIRNSYLILDKPVGSLIFPDPLRNTEQKQSK